MKVSVIVPVYNVYNYLDKCLDSLAKQTLKEIEVIIVNDGTKDNSQEIIDKYVKKYKNMRCIIKENGGLSDARNKGINACTGEYIAFLDSDDYITYDMYEKMYEKAISDNFDMVVCDLNYVYSDKKVRAYSNIPNDTTNIKKVMQKIYPVVCNKLFKSSLFNDKKMCFKKGIWYEDVEFIYRLLPHVKKIGVLHDTYYQYVQRDGSINNTVSPKIYDYIDNFNGIVDYYKKEKLYDEYRKELEYSYVRYLYATFVRQSFGYEYKDYLKAVDTAIKNVKKQFPYYYKNKYFYQSIKGIYLLFFTKTLAKILYKMKRK